LHPNYDGEAGRAEINTNTHNQNNNLLNDIKHNKISQVIHDLISAEYLSRLAISELYNTQQSCIPIEKQNITKALPLRSQDPPGVA
jgi:hypothetical protein